MMVWDTAGTERFKAMTYSFYKKADMIMVCFDLTDHKSFVNVKTWLEAVKEHAKINVPVMLIGNKYDKFQER